MAGEEPGKAARTRANRPGPRRKAKAGIIVAVVLFVLVAIIFVTRNFEHAKELEENPSPPLPTAGQNG